MPAEPGTGSSESLKRTLPLAEFKEGCYLDALFNRRARAWTPCVLHALLDMATAVIDAKDREGRYLFANQAFSGLCGLPIEQVAGCTDAELFPAERAAAWALHDRSVLESGQPESYEETLARPDGPHTYLVHKFPIRDPREDMPIAVGSLRFDVTERRAIEQRLIEHNMELRVAQQIQQSLLPTTMPKLPGFEVAAACVPAQETGGDYLDFIPLPQGRLGLVIGDASGHGVGAALLMAETRAFVRCLARCARQTDAIVNGVNQALAQDMPGGHFVTLFLGILDLARRTLQFANAGHLAGLVFDETGNVKHRLESTGCPLGVDEGLTVAAGPMVTLASRDTLVLITDGIVEAFHEEGAPYGLERLLRVIRRHISGDPHELVRMVLDDVRKFAHGLQHDDCSILVVRVT